MSAVTPKDEATTEYPMVSLRVIPRGSFATNLMAPMVTIYVGQERVKYQAHQETLCQLEFFRVALKGDFKEASEKTISMPEDDPGLIAALIEYLYTESYNCDCSDVPYRKTNLSGELLEAYFHWELSITAEKYLYDDLQEESMEESLKLYSELLDIEQLRFLKAIYAKDVSANLSVPVYKMTPIEAKLWVRDVRSKNSKEFGKTMLDYPRLAYDLLCVTSASEKKSKGK